MTKTTLPQLLYNLSRYVWLIPPILALLCFINTVGHGFVYDDIYHIVQAESVLGDWSAANLKAALTTDSWTFLTGKSSGKITSIYYRPVLSLYWMLTYAYSGVVAWRWHLTSVLLHALTAALVYQTILLSLRHTQSDEHNSRLLALIAATVFAVHPTQSESVAWVAAAANSLTAIPILLSLMAYLKARQGSTLWLAVSAVFYALALFTKEFAVILPLLLLAYELFLLDKLPSLAVWLHQAAVRSIPFLIITLSYIAVRVWLRIPLTAQIISSDFPEVSVISRLVQLYTLPTVILTYLKNILLPFSLKPFYPVYHIYKPDIFNFYLPFLAILLLGAATLLMAWRSPSVRLGLVWFLTPLLPALEFRAFMPECIVQDRYLYLPLIGAGFLLGCAVLWLNRRLTGSETPLRSSIALVLCILLVVSGITTAKQNLTWADEWSYWSAAQQGLPQGCLPNKEMGRLCYNAELYTQAVKYYEQARAACPYSAYVRSQLGAIYGRLGALDKAEAENRQAIALLPSPDIASGSYYNLGLTYQIKGDKAQARTCFQKAIELNPNSAVAAQAHKNLQELKTD